MENAEPQTQASAVPTVPPAAEPAAKRSVKAVPPPKAPRTDEELKAAVNLSYDQSNRTFKIVKEAVDKMTDKFKQPIMELIGFADESLRLKLQEDEEGHKQYSMDFDLTDDQLEFLAIKIPTACLKVQEQINDRALDTAIAEYIFDDAVTEKLKQQLGGDAKERMRFAEQQAEVERLVHMIKSQVYANLRSYVDRADKVYEGVKKVLDGRAKEKRLGLREQRYAS